MISQIKKEKEEASLNTDKMVDFRAIVAVRFHIETAVRLIFVLHQNPSIVASRLHLKLLKRGEPFVSTM